MPNVVIDGTSCAVEPGETVLECLIRNGHSIPNSCRAGVCQSCLLQATSGIPPPESAKSLKTTLTEQGYFLACACHPTEDLTVALPGAGLRYSATIANILPLSDSIALVQIKLPEDFEYRIGQYITLIRPDGLARTYSISSGSDPRFIDLHIRRIPGGAFSEWIHREARPGDALDVLGPAGECYYAGIRPDQPILLAGTGTGLAPLFGILQDALTHEHQGPLWLYHGAVNEKGLYLREMLTGLAEDNQNVHYTAAVLQESPNGGNGKLVVGKLDEIILNQHPDIKDFRAYLCGDPGIVNSMRTKLFLAGIPSREIFADAFLPAPSAK